MRISRSKLRDLCKDPLSHIRVIQGAKLQPYQKKIVRTIAEHDRTVITACHDVGKTFTLAKCVLWLGSTFPGAKIITTAPTFRQVKLLLWSEIRNGYKRARAHLGGQMLQTEWKISEDWFAVGFASKKEAKGSSAQGSGFQGVHGKWVIIILDEAQGVARSIWDQVEGMTTSANVKVIAIGNPYSRDTAFFEATKDEMWKHIRLSCFDSPNLKANRILGMPHLVREIEMLKEMTREDRLARIASYKIVAPELLTTKWVIELCLKLGIEHPLVQAKALGEFPEGTDHRIFSLELVDECLNSSIQPTIGENFHLGVDVARYGGDKSVITPIQKDYVHEPIVMVKKDNTQVAGRIMHEIKRLNMTRGSVTVDATGLGSGVIDILRENRRLGLLPDGINLYEVHFGASADFDDDKKDKSKPPPSSRYANLKARMFWELAEAMKEGLRLPSNTPFEEELPNIRYDLDSKGRILIESKDEYIERTGNDSPDHADSLGLANLGKNQYNKKLDVTFDLSGLSLGSTSTWRV